MTEIKEEKKVSKKKQKYLDFISSKEWKEIRCRVMKARGMKCERCRARENLHVHHLTYERFGGNEKDSDLKILCKQCHMDIHGLKPGGKAKKKIGKNKRKLMIYKRLAFDKYDFKNLKDVDVCLIGQNSRSAVWLAKMIALSNTGRIKKFSSKRKAMEYIKVKLYSELKAEKRH